MSIVKLLLKIIAVFVLFVGVAIGALVAFVDPNDFKEDIIKQVEEQTGRDFAMQSINLSIFPKIGLSIEKAQLSNAKGFSEQPFAAIDEVQIGAAIMPLFSKQLVIDAVSLKGLALNLETHADGTTNWQDLTGTPTEDEKPEEKTSDNQPADNPLADLASLEFGGVSIVNGNVSWKDDSAQQEIKVTDLNLNTGAVEFGQYFPVSLSAKTALKNPSLTNTIDLAIDVKVEQNGEIEVKNLELTNQTDSNALPFQKLVATLNIPTINLALETQQVSLPSIKANFDVTGGSELPLATAKSELQIDNFAMDLNTQVITIPKVAVKQQGQGKADFILQDIQSEITLADLNLDLAKQIFSASNTQLSSDIRSEQLPLPAEGAKIRLSTPFTADLQKQTLSLPNLQLAALETQTQASVSVSQLLDGPKVDAKLKTAPFNLKQLLAQLKIELPPMQSATALQKVGQETQVKFDLNAQQIQVPFLKLTLDESQLDGSASMKNFAKPTINFDLALDKININQYLPPKTQETKTEEPSKSDEELVIELPVDLIKQQNINGQLKIADLTFDKLNPKNILVKLKAKDGKVEILPAKADMFDTQITLQSSLDVNPAEPVYSVKLHAPKVPVGDVLKAVADNDVLSGLGSVDADLSTQGKTIKAFMANLDGTAAVDLNDGAVKGFNLAQMIRDAKAKFSGEKTEAVDETKQTDFSSLIAKVGIVKGLVTSKEITASSPYLRVNGDGKANLATETLDFLVKTKVVGTEVGQGGKQQDDLKGLTIPVKIKGSFYDPKFSLDLKSLIDAKAKQELEAKKAKLKAEAEAKLKAKQDEIKEKAQEKLNDAVEDKLKDALKGFKF